MIMEVSEDTLTKEQLESLALYLDCFKRAYVLCTGKKLQTVEQIIEVIKEGDFTFEDVFMTYMDECLGIHSYATEDDNIFWEDHMEMFDCQNYFPNKKRIKEGAWIKIRTEKGFEVHWAKTAMRKRRFEEEIESLQKKLISLLNGQSKDLKDATKKIDEILTPAKKIKEKELNYKISELHVRTLINLKPYEVVINRTKSVKEYYLPYQYEVIENIEEFSDAYVSGVPGVDIKRFYTSNNADAVFYLTSRGISKKTAEMMATLKQTYFVVNLHEAIEAYNGHLKRTIKIVHHEQA